MPTDTLPGSIGYLDDDPVEGRSEADNQHAGRGEELPEHGERPLELRRRHVDRRVPGEDARYGVLSGVYLGHGTELELGSWMGCPRVRDELGNYVHAGHVGAQSVQEGGPMTGTAAEVEHRSRKSDQVPPDQGRVVLMVLPPAIEEIDVLLGRDGVGDADGPQAHCCRIGRRPWRFGHWT